MIDTIFLDMDGVLVDWCGKVMDLFQRHDIRDALKESEPGKIHKLLGIDEGLLWKIINFHEHRFWSSIKPFPWTRHLIDTCKALPCNVGILSSPTGHFDTAPHACKGKTISIERLFPDVPYAFAYKKHLMASPTKLLVDDTGKKLRAFEEHGGKVFRFPNQFKLLDGELSIDDVLSDLIRTFHAE